MGRLKYILLLGLLLISFSASPQCAMCKAVIESGNASEAEGLNSGILYLMVFPYLLVGTLIFLIYKNRKKIKI
jgi:hypothetical protein